MKHSKGFTLAELLAVVIIISIMVTFGVGSYRKSRQQAYFTEVLNKANAKAEKLNQEYFEKTLQGKDVSDMDTSAYECHANYCVDVTTNYADVRDRVACVGSGSNGKTFCESMGYKTCTTGDAAEKTSVPVCTK